MKNKLNIIKVFRKLNASEKIICCKYNHNIEIISFDNIDSWCEAICSPKDMELCLKFRKKWNIK